MDTRKAKHMILIVDDEPINIKILKNTLQKSGFNTSSSQSGKDAIITAGSTDTDLILMDIMMPEMDGYEACERLREDPKTKETPIIFLTAKTDTKSIVRGFEAGGQDYITKPFDRTELLARIRTHLDLKENRDRIKEMNEELQDANRSKDELVSILAHDIASPITALSTALELLENGVYGDISEKQKDLFEKMQKSLERLEKLRKDTLILSRMDSSSIELEKEMLSIGTIVDRSVGELMPILEEKEIHLSIDLPDLPRINMDPNRIHQVLDNYISNAIRYSGKGKNIHIGGEKKDGSIRIWIKDEGRGLDKKELKKVFDRFYRTGKRVKGSTGLGLSIVKSIVELHGGGAW
ncbi:MAG: hybrid sensor histidine kinase/response regulator [Candidatus Thermoplasmatota archaeon]|nr:hybrid sensor histidine kinase/response regulator [Candidatus Thermoplasmatota archaeon]